MDPLTIANLALAGITGIQKIAQAIAALSAQRATPEQIALLQSLRAENQVLATSTMDRLKAIENGGAK